VVAFVTDRAKVVEVLERLGLPTEPPRTARARAPPVQEKLFEPASALFAADPIHPDARTGAGCERTARRRLSPRLWM
jgi:hypothetical protein